MSDNKSPATPDERQAEREHIESRLAICERIQRERDAADTESRRRAVRNGSPDGMPGTSLAAG